MQGEKTYTKDQQIIMNEIPLRYIKAKIDNEIKIDLKKSWYLSGLAGTGKTYFCYATQIKSEAFIHIYNFALIVGRLRTADFVERHETEDEIISRKFVIIDDLGSELRTDYSNDLLFRILNSRYEHMRWTGITSNLPVKELPYEDRIKSRILGIVGENRFNLATKDRRVE